MSNECAFCTEFDSVDLADTTKLVERNLDDYAYVGVRAWIDDERNMRVFAVTDKNSTFASTDCVFTINYCPICGRELRGADNAE